MSSSTNIVSNSSELRFGLVRLPTPLTPFIGRKQEQVHLTQLLSENRLVTLTGPAGTGKTRLGIQVAGEIQAQFAHGIYFVQLASIQNPDLVIPTIARTLGISTIQAGPGETLFDKLAFFLHNRQLLLLLNNFEQVLEATPQITALLETCPFLKILITCRVGLRVYGEVVFAVPPLSFPNIAYPYLTEKLPEYDAISFFVNRARTVKPGFSLDPHNAQAVSAICRQLEGLPLALEWAAARINIFTPQTIFTQLNRQVYEEVLGHTLDWSYALLSIGQQKLLGQLGVFAGGCNLKAIQTVCADSPGVNKAAMTPVSLDDLAILVNNGLVERDIEEPTSQGPRFKLRESVREYALGKLAQKNQLELMRAAHATFYLDLAEETEPKLGGAESVQWLTALETEHPNLRLALQWAKEQFEPQILLRLSSALSRMWYIQGYFEEGQQWLEQALAHNQPAIAGAVTKLRAKVLNGAGALASTQARYQQAQRFYEESLTLWQELGESQQIGDCLSNLGTLAGYQGSYDRSQNYFRESLALRRQIEDEWGIAASLTNLGATLMYQGETTPALEFHQESLEIWLKRGDQQGIAHSYFYLGQVEYARCNYDASLDFFRKSITLNRELNNSWIIASCLQEIGSVAAAKKQPIRAVKLLGAAEALRKALQTPASQADDRRLAEALETARSIMEEGLFLAAYKLSQFLTQEEAVALALLDDRPAELEAGALVVSGPITLPSLVSPAIWVDDSSGTISVKNRELGLRGQQRTLFCYLYNERGLTHSIQDIKKVVWKTYYSPDIVTDENVHQLIRQLRRKIEKLELPDFDAKKVISYNPALRGYVMPLDSALVS